MGPGVPSTWWGIPPATTPTGPESTAPPPGAEWPTTTTLTSVSRLLAGGHEITSHTYSHVLFGWKPLVYGRRKYLKGLEPVVGDLKKLHRAMEKGWGYPVRLGRPPHYVDGIQGGFTSYDAYALMGYQYMAASFDGAGWLPLESYEAEVEATWKPMERLLLEDPDAFCGQIIFQKDGFNMARRTPVAFGLKKQL